MSVKARCYSYCNDSNNKNGSQWKIVEAKKSDRNKYEKIDDKYCCDSCYEKDTCGLKKSNFLCTLVSVKNPSTDLPIPDEIIPLSSTSQCGDNLCIDLQGWSDVVPDALHSFDKSTGTFTAPEDGDYQISLVVNFKVSDFLSIPPPGTEIPYIEIYDPDAPCGHVLSSAFPVTYVVVQNPSTGEPAITILAVLLTGQVVINGVVPLKACQRLRLRACTNGLHFVPPPVIGPIPTNGATIDLAPPCFDTTFTISKIRNSPIVTIHCNN